MRAGTAGRYEVGRGALSSEVLDAERDLLATQQQVVQAEHALLTARCACTRRWAAARAHCLAPLPAAQQPEE